MIWAGKLTGAAVGLLTGGPVGAFIGGVAGHLFDRALGRALYGQLEAPAPRSGGTSRSGIQLIFFQATFRTMGRLAKVDGRVSEAEIAAATHVMDQMQLQGAQRQSAIECFNQGKQADFDLSDDLQALKQAIAQHSSLAQMFLEIQLSVAYADGKLSAAERKLFDRLCRALGVSAFQFEWIHSRVRAAMSSAGRQSGQRSAGQSLNKAYEILGVSKDVDDAALKQAYRRLMSQNHPDKLVAKGLPEEMLRLAKEKTQQIQDAYDHVRKARGQK
ncbi:molecular chaperone DjlA [Bacterioplanes sanyensis]|uniref:Co-chaperone protein DjlA n=1 Tax=Bacterioplanes sanyensis TaxID=1249553 RepID=A0A222FFJ5_9GAMM|nr:co-chaperone DjlA [Bacterioplanes sanyensis]ASP37402.1 molecular chaperone DjlA [Bacterioplanes sanyensis]